MGPGRDHPGGSGQPLKYSTRRRRAPRAAEPGPAYRAGHPGYIVDASVACKLFRSEPDAELARALPDLAAAGRLSLHAPQWLLIEVANALRKDTSATAQNIREHLDILQSVGINLHPLDSPLLRGAVELSVELKLSMYDAIYAALGQRLGFPVVSADREFVRRFRNAGQIILLASLQLPDQKEFL